MSTKVSERDNTGSDPNSDWFEVVRRNVSNLRFGSVVITVHDGRVTQVESIEKTRFTAPRGELAT